LDIGEAARWIQQNPDILLVDTRTQQEYEVSHLPGAIHWDVEEGNPLPPNLTQAGDAGRQVLFYCSIGYRSGKACRRFLDVYPDAETFNMKGGLFQWAEQMGALEGGDQVHPYDETWGDLLRPDLRWSSNKSAQTK
jgi:rhodanese-related sulfurtransferase